MIPAQLVDEDMRYVGQAISRKTPKYGIIWILRQKHEKISLHTFADNRRS